MIIDYNTPNRPVIIGLDHGFGNVKTAHICFQAGVTKHEKEPAFKSNMLVFDVFNAVHTTDWHEPETLEHWREAWCRMVNDEFERKGLDVRIDHRSYEAQGIEQIPSVHEGPLVQQMEKRGLRTQKGDLNRWIKATNRLSATIRQ